MNATSSSYTPMARKALAACGPRERRLLRHLHAHQRSMKQSMQQQRFTLLNKYNVDSFHITGHSRAQSVTRRRERLTTKSHNATRRSLMDSPKTPSDSLAHESRDPTLTSHSRRRRWPRASALRAGGAGQAREDVIAQHAHDRVHAVDWQRRNGRGAPASSDWIAPRFVGPRGLVVVGDSLALSDGNAILRLVGVR